MWSIGCGFAHVLDQLVDITMYSVHKAAAVIMTKTTINIDVWAVTGLITMLLKFRNLYFKPSAWTNPGRRLRGKEWL